MVAQAALDAFVYSSQPLPGTIAWPALQCPEDGRLLRAAGEALHCAQGHKFLARQNVPRFLPRRWARNDTNALLFSCRQAQRDSYTNAATHRRRLQRLLGESLWYQLERRHVLVVGQCTNRFSEVLVARGAYVTAVELGDVPLAHLSQNILGSQHRIMQACMRALPFAAQQFDIVVCLNTLEQTKSPEANIAHLYKQVRPGGALLVCHRHTTLAERLNLPKEALRQGLRALPPEWCWLATERVTRVARSQRLSVWERAKLLGAPMQGESPRALPKDTLHKWRMADTFASLTALHQHRRSPTALKKHLKKLGARVEHCAIAKRRIEVRASRPS